MPVALAEWLPRIAAVLTLILGLVGFFKPRLLVGAQDIQVTSAAAWSEMRVVFGGIHLGYSIGALLLQEPVVYIAIGLGWLFGFFARFVSMVLDKTSLKESMTGIIVDGLLAFLFLSGFIFG